MRNPAILSTVGIIAILSCCRAPAFAGPILPSLEYSAIISSAYWDGTQYIQGTDILSVPSDSRGGSSVTSAFASFSSALSPVPMVTASSSTDSADFLLVGSASVNFSLIYYFEATGPGVVVPVHVTASGSSSDNSSGSASTAAMSVGLVGQPASLLSPYKNWTMDTDFNVYVGQVYRVQLNVQTITESAGDGPHSTWATVDPMFSIDPLFPDADQYQLFFSPGIATPQPSGISLLAAMALSASVMVGLRKRQRVAP